MRSRLVAVVVLAVIAAVAVGGHLSRRAEREPAVADAGGGQRATAADATTPTTPPATTRSVTSTAALDPVQQVAVEGVRAWQERDVTARSAALALVATPEYAAAIRGVDPAVVPACTVEEVRTDLEADGLVRVAATCRTGLVLLVDLALDGDRWLVADIAPGT